MGYYKKLEIEKQELGIIEDEQEMQMDELLKAEAEIISQKEFKKAYQELDKYNQSEVMMIAENNVLGI
tara:strand:- start:260 stop:463 length:204 start_codon:yes stop_codon:yes gene_type:complete